MAFSKEQKTKYKKIIGKKLRIARGGMDYKIITKEKEIMSQSQLSRLENGELSIDFIVLLELAILYKKPIEDFIPKSLLHILSVQKLELKWNSYQED